VEIKYVIKKKLIQILTLNIAMEDAHCAELDLEETEASFFGVYDGHGG
jgi:serine/threonine protein phosphatase PrpC